MRLSLPNTLLLVASSCVLYWGERGIRNGRTGRLKLAVALTLFMDVAFVIVQRHEWHSKKFLPWDSAYASSYYTTTGFHLLHVIGGLLMLAPVLLWSLMGKFGAERHAAVSIGALYWHFVDVIWLLVFFTYYITPYFAGRHHERKRQWTQPKRELLRRYTGRAMALHAMFTEQQETGSDPAGLLESRSPISSARALTDLRMTVWRSA